MYVAIALLLWQKNSLNNLVEQVGNQYSASNFKIKNQFYTRNSAEKATTSAVSGMTGEHDYKIAFQAMNKESFVIVGELGDTVQTVAITTIYGKYGNNWKLNVLQIGVIKVLNQDAIDWYKQSKHDYDSGKLADAANKFTISARLAKPAKDYWTYQKTDEIQAYGVTLFNALQKAFPFPMKIAAGATQISILNFAPEFSATGYFPSIAYVSSISLEDTTALSHECDRLHAIIGKVFQGIDQVNKGILYRVFQTMPTIGNEKNYQFLRRLRK